MTRHRKRHFALTGLFLAALFAASSVQAQNWSYTVRPGDNLWALSHKYLHTPADWDKVAKLNKLKQPHVIPVGIILKIPYQLLKNQPYAASVSFVSGEVLYKSDRSTVKKKDIIELGSHISTGENGLLHVRMADNSVMRIGPNSSVKFDAVGAFKEFGMVDTRIRIDRGSAVIQVPPSPNRPRFQINTPAAVAAVRGTEFRIGADSNSMQSATLQGQVDVSASGSTQAVNKGFGTLADAGSAPIKPRPLLAAPNFAESRMHFHAAQGKIRWPAVDGASSYAASITNSDGHLLRSEKLKTSELSVAGLDEGNYKASVRGIDIVGIGGYDAEHSFTMNPAQTAPSAPQLSKYDSFYLYLSWQHDVPASHYQIQLAQDRAFRHMLIQTVTQTPSITWVRPPDGQYFARVRSIEPDGSHGVFSEATKLSVGPRNFQEWWQWQFRRQRAYPYSAH